MKTGRHFSPQYTFKNFKTSNNLTIIKMKHFKNEFGLDVSTKENTETAIAMDTIINLLATASNLCDAGNNRPIENRNRLNVDYARFNNTLKIWEVDNSKLRIAAKNALKDEIVCNENILPLINKILA